MKLVTMAASDWHRAQAERMAGQHLLPWHGADIDSLVALLVEIDAIRAETSVQLSPGEAWGLSPEQMRERAQAVAARRKRRAGYSALKSKYGEESAKWIVGRAKAARS